MRKTLLFDLDGTLSDPILGTINCIKTALTQMGKELPARETLNTFIGPPLHESFKKHCNMTSEEAWEAVRLYRVRYGDVGLFENEMYSGIPEMLDSLLAAGYRLAVASSKLESYVRRILDHFGLADRFLYIAGSNPEATCIHKADVIRYCLDAIGASPDECVMIGDRLHDVAGAQANNMPSIGVLWGFGSAEELTEAGASRLCRTPADLLGVLASINETDKI